MLETLRQYLRPFRYARRRRSSLRLARTPSPYDAEPGPAPGFIVGCGRSGTTILGKIFQTHPEVRYLFEPYHLWAAVDPRTDATNLYHRGEARLIMDASFADDQARLRFNRCILSQRAGRPILIEKTPQNAMRLGFLEALAPGARYAHIVRDGVSVANSIARVAEENEYKVVGRPRLNQWWGEDDVKWRILVRDGAAGGAGYFASEVGALTTHAQRGAYEWLVSLLEVDRGRAALGPRLHEFTYESLLTAPRETLTALTAFFGRSAPSDWLDTAVSMLGEGRTKVRTIPLPPGMAAAFNAYQARWGFPGRAEPMP